MPGPLTGHQEHVVVSFTEFRAERFATFPSIVAAGLRLSQGWYAMNGAIGLLLWAQPLRCRGGSLSVWRDEDSLRRFVGLPRHVEIMRKFGPLVGVRSVLWTRDQVSPAALKSDARPLLETPSGTPLTAPAGR